ncbi:MAG: hypothetical protein WCX61_04315 [Candidatus Peribacteraceae bacterium]
MVTRLIASVATAAFILSSVPSALAYRLEDLQPRSVQAVAPDDVRWPAWIGRIGSYSAYRFLMPGLTIPAKFMISEGNGNWPSWIGRLR